MATNLDDLLPSADQLRQKIALAEAEKAAEAFRKHAEVEAQKKAEIERLAAPSGRTEEEKIQIAAKVIQRAIASGATEMLVYRFPKSVVYGSRPGHKPDGAGLGKNSDRHSEGGLSVVVRLPAPTWIQNKV